MGMHTPPRYITSLHNKVLHHITFFHNKALHHLSTLLLVLRAVKSWQKGIMEK